jgi:hypothetical protein
MGKYDFLFTTPQNSYLDQALPPISRNPQPLFNSQGMVTGSNRRQLSPEMMRALTGRNMTRPMPLPMSKPRRAYSGPLPMSRPSRTSSMPIPTSKPTLSGPAPDFVKMPMPLQPVAPQPAAPAAPQGFLQGLLGSGFDDPRTQGILAASAALLEGGGPRVGVAPSLGQNIGRAINAYNTGRMGAEDRIAAQSERDFNKRYKEMQMREMENRLSRANDPILQDIQGGAFTRVTDPVTGESKIVRNDEVADFLEKQKTASKTINLKLSDKQIEAQTEELDNISATTDLMSDTDKFLDMMTPDPETGELELEFGLADRFGDSIALSTGMGNVQEARNSDAFNRYISRLRNELLRMAKGVQTDGDAERAINEIVSASATKDTEAVRQAMEELREVQQRTIRRYRAKIQNRRKAKGLSKFEFAEKNADGIGYTVVEDEQ